jgi:hypothetical protein
MAAYHTLLRNGQGLLLSKEELRDPAIFGEATRGIAGYSSIYTYDRTAHIRLARLPYLGKFLSWSADHILPGWEEGLNWSFVVQRRSIAFT